MSLLLSIYIQFFPFGEDRYRDRLQIQIQLSPQKMQMSIKVVLVNTCLILEVLKELRFNQRYLESGIRSGKILNHFKASLEERKKAGNRAASRVPKITLRLDDFLKGLAGLKKPVSLTVYYSKWKKIKISKGKEHMV